MDEPIENLRMNKKKNREILLDSLLMKPNQQNQINQDFYQPFAKSFEIT